MPKTKRDENVRKRTKKDDFVLEKGIWTVDNGVIEKFLPKQEKEEWL